MLRVIGKEFERQVVEVFQLASRGESTRFVKLHGSEKERKVITYSRDKLNQIALENFNREVGAFKIRSGDPLAGTS